MPDHRLRSTLLAVLGAVVVTSILALLAGAAYISWKMGDGRYVLLGIIVPVAVIVLMVVVSLMLGARRRAGMGMGRGRGMGRMEAKTVTRPETRFSDVAGVEEAKEELAEVVEFLRSPERFRSLGATIPKGVLLAGPPGTGKTLLSKAVAGEAGVAFLAISASEFVEMVVGVGASRVRSLFASARKQAPCIIFIDEIDAVGRRRSAGMTGGGNDEREQTLNQLLVEMDGFEKSANIIVIAATNRIDILDPALLRPGRFDRQVHVDVPDVAGRLRILEVHARNKPLSPSVSLQVIAKETPGFSGADLANVMNEAALLAARRDASHITMEHLEEAIARVLGGPERKSRILTERERAVIAHHEAGHALLFHALANCDPVHKITIVSRGRSLGWTMAVPEHDRVLLSRAQLRDQLAAMLGGRCAERLIFGEEDITTGAYDDLARATQTARRMVTEWGMSALGLRTFSGVGSEVALRDHSEQMAWSIDEEVDRLIAEAEKRAMHTLRRYTAALDAIATRLLEVETLEAEQMIRIVEENPPEGAAEPVAQPQQPTAGAGTRERRPVLTHAARRRSALTRHRPLGH